MKRARNYCCVDGCKNKRNDEKLSFFKLPKESARRELWLQIIGRPDLLSRADLKSGSHHVCVIHFSKSSIQNVKKLCPDAIPTKFVPDQPIGTDDSDMDEKSTQTEDMSLTDGLRETTRINYKSNKDKKTKQFQISQIALSKLNKTKKISQASKATIPSIPSAVEIINLINKPSTSKSTTNRKKMVQGVLAKHSKRASEIKVSVAPSEQRDEITTRFCKLAEWQSIIRNRGEGGKYDYEFKHFALNLHLWSPQVYRSLQTMLELPDEKALSRFKLNVRPEIDDKILNCLSLKLKSLPSAAKYCTMCLDAIDLRKHLYYDIRNDEVIGLCNVGGKITEHIAANAYIIMLRGIVVNWTQPIAYAFVESIGRYQDLDKWISKVILQLSELGLKVKAVVSNQSSNFDKFAKDIKQVTIKKPYFELNKNRIYYIFDIPHLINSVRNDLICNDFYYEERLISWRYIESLFFYQKMQNLQLLPQVTDAHIKPNNCQMSRIKYAAQIFSRSMFIAFNTVIYAKYLEVEARQTAEFVMMMNDLFDVLNSTKVFTNVKTQRAFTLNINQVEILQLAQLMFQKMTAKSTRSRSNVTARLKTFKNIQISIQAIIMISEDLKRNGFEYILTRRLNKEPLDKFCAAIPQYTRSNTDPTPVEFTRAFSKLFVRNLLKNSPSSGSQPDLYDIILKGHNLLLPFPAIFPSIVPLDGEIDYRFDLAKLPKQNILKHVADYIIYRCQQKHTCTQLDNWFQDVNDDEDVMEYRLYFRHLLNQSATVYNPKSAPQSFVNFVNELEVIFLEHAEQLMTNKPANSLLSLLEKVAFEKPCPCFPHAYLLKLFVRLRMFITMKYNNKCLKDGDLKIITFLKL